MATIKLKKTYRVFLGQNLRTRDGWSQNLYGSGHMMDWVAYSTRNGVIHMGQGDDKQEALADLSLRMFGHDEHVHRFKVIEG